jgi:hypothetical protein
MKLSAAKGNDTVLWAVLGVFLLGTCVYVYEEVFTGGSPSSAPPAQVASAPAATNGGRTVAGEKPARLLGTTSASLDPTLHMDAMLVSEAVEYSGTGRNIFSPTSVPPVVIPQPKAPARPQQVAAVPCPPNCPLPPGPPPPPPIDLKYFGVVTGANGARRALLLQGENVFVASPGEVVMRRYRVIAVDARTIQVEDLQNNNKQTLPLLAN